MPSSFLSGLGPSPFDDQGGPACDNKSAAEYGGDRDIAPSGLFGKALRFEAFCFQALRLKAFGFDSLCFQSFGFKAFGLYSLCFEPLRLKALCFDSLGLKPLGFQARFLGEPFLFGEPRRLSYLLGCWARWLLRRGLLCRWLLSWRLLTSNWD